MLFPLHCMMYIDLPPVFARDPRVIPPGPMLFCALRKISGCIGWCTGFIYQIISCWDSICWEGEMFHDMSELDLGFGHFRRDWLEGLQVDAAGYWFIISGLHDMGFGNAMWSFVGVWRGIPGGCTVSHGIHCRNWVFKFVLGVAPVSGDLLCVDCSCGGRIYSPGRMWDGVRFVCFWRGRKFLLGF